MGDDRAPSTQESTASIMQALTTYLPGYMNAVNAQVLPQAQTELRAAQSISPAYAELLDQLYTKYAPKMAQTGTEVERINRTGAAATDLEILQGKGGDLARESVKIDKELNPEFYATRSATADKLGQLLSAASFDSDVEAERLINAENVRSGNVGNPSATQTVSNALSFGNERNNRLNRLGQAISTATQFLQPAQGQFNPTVTALNRPSTNTGESRFGGVTNPSQQAYTQGSNMFNNISQVRMQQNDINANRRDGLDRFNETLSGIGSIVSI